MQVYLAGGIGDWRDPIKKRWPLWTCVDPFDNQEVQRSIATFTLIDLQRVSESDLIFAYHNYHIFDGLAVECGAAYAWGKPIIYVCTQKRISSMIAGISRAVFTDLEPALTYVETRMRRPGDLFVLEGGKK